MGAHAARRSVDRIEPQCPSAKRSRQVARTGETGGGGCNGGWKQQHMQPAGPGHEVVVTSATGGLVCWLRSAAESTAQCVVFRSRLQALPPSLVHRRATSGQGRHLQKPSAALVTTQCRTAHHHWDTGTLAHCQPDDCGSARSASWRPQMLQFASAQRPPRDVTPVSLSNGFLSRHISSTLAPSQVPCAIVMEQ